MNGCLRDAIQLYVSDSGGDVPHVVSQFPAVQQCEASKAFICSSTAMHTPRLCMQQYCNVCRGTYAIVFFSRLL